MQNNIRKKLDYWGSFSTIRPGDFYGVTNSSAANPGWEWEPAYNSRITGNSMLTLESVSKSSYTPYKTNVLKISSY